MLSSTSNMPEMVFDYFIKDYLGNVRVVITEEDATLTDKWLATMEEVHAHIEENDFDNLPEFRDDLPTGYPIDASVEFNERIARLSAENGTTIGPAKFLKVRDVDRISGGVSYFYSENAPGATYQNLGMFVEEMLIAIAASGVGVLPIQPDQLLNIAAGGNSQLNNSLAQLLGTSFDTASTTTPHAYLVWTAYDSQFKVNLNNSGAIRVLDPNSLERILTESITIQKDGYLHVYVSNGSQAAVSFDNFLVQSIRGNVRQINHYYPYGLSIAGLNQQADDYLHGYQSKQLMTDDFVSLTSSGLEMYDFHARLYDPQLGRWFAPDPAEQFSNPYLAMGNNPVMYIDPDGREIFTVFLGTVVIKAALPTIIIAASTAIAVTASAYIASQVFAPLLTNSMVPPDGYIHNGKRLIRINDDGASEGLDYFYEGQVYMDGTYSTTGRFLTQPMGESVIMKPIEGSLKHAFNYSTTQQYGYLAQKLPGIPAGAIETANSVGNLKTGLTAFKASQTAKTQLIRLTGASSSLPAWYSKLGLSIGVSGAIANAAINQYQMDNGQISKAQGNFSAIWGSIGTNPHIYAQSIYWSGVAGQYYGPSTWGWDIFGPTSSYGRFKNRLHKP